MSKKFILYKYDEQENSLVYISCLSASKIEFTASPAHAKRYNALLVFVYAMIYDFNWINEKHTIL